MVMEDHYSAKVDCLIFVYGSRTLLTSLAFIEYFVVMENS